MFSQCETQVVGCVILREKKMPKQEKLFTKNMYVKKIDVSSQDILCTCINGL